MLDKQLECGCCFGAKDKLDIYIQAYNSVIEKMCIMCHKKHHLKISKIASIPNPFMFSKLSYKLQLCINTYNVKEILLSTCFYSFVLEGNSIGLKGAQAIASILNRPNNIKTLDLGIFII